MEGSFEQRLAQVKEIIEGIEGGQMPLEETIRKYESGMKALNQLEKELEDTRRRITVLMEGTEEPEEKPLEVQP